MEWLEKNSITRSLVVLNNRMSSVGWFVQNRIGGYANVRMHDCGLQAWNKDPTAPIGE
jgi:3-mercaptopyruvate sulfurtransferase SseA